MIIAKPVMLHKITSFCICLPMMRMIAMWLLIIEHGELKSTLLLYSMMLLLPTLLSEDHMETVNNRVHTKHTSIIALHASFNNNNNMGNNK